MPSAEGGGANRGRRQSRRPALVAIAAAVIVTVPGCGHRTPSAEQGKLDLLQRTVAELAPRPQFPAAASSLAYPAQSNVLGGNPAVATVTVAVQPASTRRAFLDVATTARRRGANFLSVSCSPSQLGARGLLVTEGKAVDLSLFLTTGTHPTLTIRAELPFGSPRPPPLVSPQPGAGAGCPADVRRAVLG